MGVKHVSVSRKIIQQTIMYVLEYGEILYSAAAHLTLNLTTTKPKLQFIFVLCVSFQEINIVLITVYCMKLWTGPHQ